MAKLFLERFSEERIGRLEEERGKYGDSRYPVGVYSFAEIRERNMVYVDKTEYIYRMVHSGMCSVFLSRPRQFGKSLLVSTMQSYFEGRGELFEGLAIGRLEKEWKEYPVLRFDMSRVDGEDKAGIRASVIGLIEEYEEVYDMKDDFPFLTIRFCRLIERVYRKTGRKVVVLVDEYDRPMLHVAHDEAKLEEVRETLMTFYIALKSCNESLAFVFMTGITEFAEMSMFSGLNNISSISLDKRYASICGITEEEMLTQMSGEIDDLAWKMGLPREAALQRIKEMYDGYHFVWPSPDIYNPYSLLKAFESGETNAYWFASGTPSYLIRLIGKLDIKPSEIGGDYFVDTSLYAPVERMRSACTLLFQSGYMTIQGSDHGSYLLDIPNKEVRIGLYSSLLPNYVGYNVDEKLEAIKGISAALWDDRLDEALKGMQAFFSSIPYVAGANTEGHYQQMLFTVLMICGLEPRLEERTAHGRIDVVYDTKSRKYVWEIKMDQSAKKAMKQINDKEYAARYAMSELPVVKVGISFSRRKHTLTDWIVAE